MKHYLEKLYVGHLRVFTRPELKEFIEMHSFASLSLKTVPLDFNSVYFALAWMFSINGMDSDVVSVSRNGK